MAPRSEPRIRRRQGGPAAAGPAAALLGTRSSPPGAPWVIRCLLALPGGRGGRVGACPAPRLPLAMALAALRQAAQRGATAEALAAAGACSRTLAPAAAALGAARCYGGIPSVLSEVRAGGLKPCTATRTVQRCSQRMPRKRTSSGTQRMPPACWWPTAVPHEMRCCREAWQLPSLLLHHAQQPRLPVAAR